MFRPCDPITFARLLSSAWRVHWFASDAFQYAQFGFVWSVLFVSSVHSFLISWWCHLVLGHHLAPFWLQFSSLFAQSSSNSAICSAFWILQILWSYYYLRGFGRNPYWAKTLQNLACRIQAEISAGFCMHNFERNIRRILYAEFRAKSPHNAACRNSAETSADLRPKSPHNSVADFRQKSLQTADLYMQSVLQNLGLCLAEISFRMCPKYLQNYAYRISANISA